MTDNGTFVWNPPGLPPQSDGTFTWPPLLIGHTPTSGPDYGTFSWPAATEAQPFKPTDIAGCRLWIDAADTSTVTLNGSLVSQVLDKSGNGNTASQGTASLQFQYILAAHNGNNTFRANADFTAYMRGGMSGLTQTSTLFIVVSRPDIFYSASAMFSSGNNDDNTGLTFIALGGDQTIDMRVGTSSSGDPFFFAANPTYTGTYSQFTNLSTLTTVQQYQDGALVASGTGSVAVDSLGSYILGGYDYQGGQPFNLTGDLSEVIVYDSVLDPTEQAIVEAYLKMKWGTP